MCSPVLLQVVLATTRVLLVRNMCSIAALMVFIRCCDHCPVATAHLAVEQQSMEVVHQALLQVMPLCLTDRVRRFLHADVLQYTAASFNWQLCCCTPC